MKKTIFEQMQDLDDATSPEEPIAYQRGVRDELSITRERAAAEEREACAKICEAKAHALTTRLVEDRAGARAGYAMACEEIAAAIRARSNQP